MAEDLIEHKPSYSQDTSDSSTQTSGLDSDFFSCEVPPRLRWSNVATDNPAKKKVPNPQDFTVPVDEVSPCRNVTLHPDQTTEIHQRAFNFDDFTRHFLSNLLFSYGLFFFFFCKL